MLLYIKVLIKVLIKYSNKISLAVLYFYIYQ